MVPTALISAIEPASLLLAVSDESDESDEPPPHPARRRKRVTI